MMKRQNSSLYRSRAGWRPPAPKNRRQTASILLGSRDPLSPPLSEHEARDDDGRCRGHPVWCVPDPILTSMPS